MKDITESGTDRPAPTEAVPEAAAETPSGIAAGGSETTASEIVSLKERVSELENARARQKAMPGLSGIGERVADGFLAGFLE